MGTPHTTTPRSVPSPAATRKELSGKTPVNHPTVSSSHGSKTLASTPMMHSLSQTGGPGIGSASPGQGPFGTPGSSMLHGLGVDMGTGLTPNLNVNVPTPVLASAVGMMPSMSEFMGVAGPSRKRNEDEERKAKMAKIMRRIGKSTGRVTSDGIQRIARRCGLDVTHDDNANEICLAGPGERMMVIVKMNGEYVQSVSPDMFPCEADKKPEEQVMGLASSKVLLQDLTVPNGILLQSSLDRFGKSLDRLARMDRLCKEQVDCFEAMKGLHTSLEKLYELEKAAVKTLRELKGSSADAIAEREVLRKRSGRPSLHGNGKIGLTLDYWTSNFDPSVSKDDSAMDVDGPEDADTQADDSPDVWSLRVEAQSCAAGIYPPLRVSDAWLPETFELPSPESADGIPWQDPPNTTVSASSSGTDGDAMAIDGGERLPDLRFVAKLDPPVLLPLGIAAPVLASLGDQYSQSTMFPLYHLKLLGFHSGDMAFRVISESSVPVSGAPKDREEDALHEYVLEVSKADLGYTLEEVPFSHPRQLVELLPTLRQWARISILLKETFDTPRLSIDPSSELSSNEPPTADLESMDLLPPTGGEVAKTRVDIAFSSNTFKEVAIPSVHMSFPIPCKDLVYQVAFQVVPNAEIVVLDCDHPVVVKHGPGEDAEADSEAQEKRELARALEICEDLGVWIEWIKKKAKV